MADATTWDIVAVLERAAEAVLARTDTPCEGCQRPTCQICARDARDYTALLALRDNVLKDREARATWAGAEVEDHGIEDRVCRLREDDLLTFIRTGQ